jgi:signal transduction histidine kinase
MRTPLTAIGGALGLLVGGVAGPLPEQAAKLLAMAEKNSDRLTVLINDLLDMEKLVEGGLPIELQVQNLMPIVDRALADIQSYADGCGVEVALIERSDVARVAVDGLRLEQVMANLLSNACKFSPSGTRVDVSVRPSGTRVRIVVSDRGRGIPDAFRDVIFEKFSQVDASDSRAIGGTGLGLAISKELVERMHGTIRHESTDGPGATFVVELPMASGEPEE